MAPLSPNSSAKTRPPGPVRAHLMAWPNCPLLAWWWGSGPPILDVAGWARLLYGMGSILIGNVSWGRSINRLSDRWVEMGVVELGSEDALHRPPAPSVSSAEPLEGGGGPAVA